MVLGKDSGFGGLAEGIDGGRDHRHHGDAFLNQKSAQLLHVEARHQYQRVAQGQGKSQPHGESVDVVEGQEAEHDVRGRERRGIRAQNLINIRNQVVVREHDALGQSGGAAGVGKGGNGLRGVLDWFREFGGRPPQQTREVFAAGVLISRVEAAGSEDAA